MAKRPKLSSEADRLRYLASLARARGDYTEARDYIDAALELERAKVRAI